jgi:hypothetical protein
VDLNVSRDRHADFAHVSDSKAFYLERVGSVGVIVWTDGSVTKEGFEEHCDAIARSVRLLGPAKLFLNWSPYFSPTAKQRSLVKEHEVAMGLPQLERLALISDSGVVRGAITALSWLAPSLRNHKAFAPKDVRSALDWLAGASTYDRQTVEGALHRGLGLMKSVPLTAAVGARGGERSAV